MNILCNNIIYFLCTRATILDSWNYNELNHPLDNPPYLGENHYLYWKAHMGFYASWKGWNSVEFGWRPLLKVDGARTTTSELNPKNE